MACIVALEQTHLQAAAELEAACFDEPWTGLQLEQELSAPGGLQLALTEGGTLCGYALLRCITGEAELLRIAVDPSMRHRGLGRALLNAALEAVVAADCGQLFLEVRAGNTTAQRLYHKAGFDVVGRRPRYYQNPEEDAVLMRWSAAPLFVEEG